MMRPVKSILASFRRFHSQDADEASAFLWAKEYKVDLLRNHAKQIDLRINGVYLPRTYIGYYQFGAPITAGTQGDGHNYWINLPLDEWIDVAIGSETVTCNPRQGFVSSPAVQYAVRTGGSGARVHVQISEELMKRQLTALLREPPTEPIVFATSIDLTKGYGRSLATYIWSAINGLEGGDSIADNPLSANLFEEYITTKILLTHPNNYSDSLAKLEKPIAPASVKRALEYMHAELGSSIGIPDIAAASGVAGRTLFKHFRDTFGVTPIQYLREARFTEVHKALSRPFQGESVTAIALRWGFTHLGRFAVEYRQRYGETPSQTLAKSCLHMANGNSEMGSGRKFAEDRLVQPEDKQLSVNAAAGITRSACK
jgi:AraC-like DNA-binding protein